MKCDYSQNDLFDQLGGLCLPVPHPQFLYYTILKQLQKPDPYTTGNPSWSCSNPTSENIFASREVK